jgi:hypothetical protein
MADRPEELELGPELKALRTRQDEIVAELVDLLDSARRS